MIAVIPQIMKNSPTNNPISRPASLAILENNGQCIWNFVVDDIWQETVELIWEKNAEQDLSVISYLATSDSLLLAINQTFPTINAAVRNANNIQGDKFLWIFFHLLNIQWSCNRSHVRCARQGGTKAHDHESPRKWTLRNRPNSLP